MEGNGYDTFWFFVVDFCQLLGPSHAQSTIVVYSVSAKQNIVHGRRPSNIGLAIFVCSGPLMFARLSNHFPV